MFKNYFQMIPKGLVRQAKQFFQSDLFKRLLAVALSYKFMSRKDAEMTSVTAQDVAAFFQENFQERWQHGVLKSEVFEAFARWSAGRNIFATTPSIFWRYVKAVPQTVKIRAQKRPGGRQRIVFLEKGE